MPNLLYTGPVGDPAINRCLKTRYLKTNFNIKNGMLKHFRLKVKEKDYICRDVSFSTHERLKTVLYHPECNHFLKVGLKSKRTLSIPTTTTPFCTNE